MNMKIKRVYEKPEIEDGLHILVDRIWPRGLTKEKAKVDIWLKDIAPSTELRKWFGHEPAKWNEFRERYLQELEKNEKQTSVLKEHVKNGMVTLVYATKDEKHNEAVVLKDFFLPESIQWTKNMNFTDNILFD